MKVNHAFGLGGEMRDWCVSTGSKILAEEFGESKPSDSHTNPLE